MNFKNIIFLSLFSLAICSCKDDAQIGPSLIGDSFAPTPTTKFTGSVEKVDFKAGKSIYFKQTFKASTRWKITFEGLNYEAISVIEGISTKIDETNSQWKGTVSSTPMFRKGFVIATLSFPDFPTFSISKDTFEITDIDAQKIETLGFLDFNNNKPLPLQYPEATGPQTPLKTGFWRADYITISNLSISFPKFDQSKYLILEGTPSDTSAYAGALNFPSSVGDISKSMFLPLYADPNRVYINMAVYGTGSKYTFLSFRMEEEIDPLNKTVENGLGILRKWDIRPNWVGWKYISIKYSDLISDDASKIYKYNPKIVNWIKLVLLSDQPLKEKVLEKVTVGIDQISFSFDAPLGTTTY